MRLITPAGTFALYATLCLAGWIFCVLCYPETAGLSLEEVHLVFQDDFGIAKVSKPHLLLRPPLPNACSVLSAPGLAFGSDR